ncbi:rootletin-like isoform X2 [Ictalurus furcatus]|uniref:rootletin-like isoform X2 n=1 Tax=Ictalurus furcatus TaxID=66913 RepID=UPI0023500D05|nr:rootletin-like isoform X2 [Ictalurus furcatus]
MLQCKITRSRAANLPLRPLLYAAGAAGTAAGVYYCIKKRRDGERTAEPVYTPPTEDSAVVESDLMSDVDAVRVTQTDRAVPEDSLSETEENNKEDEVFSAQVDRERSNLEGRVRELEGLVCEAHREYERKKKDLERETVTHVILKSQYEGSLKVSLTEAEEKYELAIESCVQLEKEKSELICDVNALQGSVQELEKELSEMRMRHDELATECKQKSLRLRVLQTKYDVMRTFLQKKYEEKLLACSEMNSQYDQTKEALTEEEVSLAEAEGQYQTSVHMNNNRILHIKELIMEAYNQQKHEQIRLELAEACWWTWCKLVRDIENFPGFWQHCCTLEHEREQEAHSVLKTQCDHMKKTHNEESIKVESDLMSLMKPLRASVQQQEKEIREIHRMYGKIMKEQEEECESHRLLKLQYTEIMKTLKQCYELLKNCLGSEEPEPQI